jgi:hypothetical protein
MSVWLVKAGSLKLSRIVPCLFRRGTDLAKIRSCMRRSKVWILLRNSQASWNTKLEMKLSSREE